MVKFLMRLKAILQNLNLLNIILMSLITVFVAYGLFPALDMNIRYVVPSAKKIVDTEEPPAGQFQVPSLAEYTMISEENLFHPDRKIPAEKKEEAVLPKPEFVLYGTLITDDLSLAYLEDLKAPRNSPGRGKRQVALKKGDSMSGFTLKEIESDKIVMLRGEEKMTVYVNDPQRPKTREEATVAKAASAQTPARKTIPRSATQVAPSQPPPQQPPVGTSLRALEAPEGYRPPSRGAAGSRGTFGRQLPRTR